MSLIILILYRHTGRLDALVRVGAIYFAHVDFGNIFGPLLFLGRILILVLFLIFFILFVDETQSLEVVFAEVTLFLHLFDSFKHGSFLLFSLSPDSKPSIKHVLFLRHELLTSLFVEINLLLNSVCLVLICSSNSGDIIQSVLALEQFLLSFDPGFILTLSSHLLLLFFLNCSRRKQTLLFLLFQLLVVILDLHLVLLLLFCLLFLERNDFFLFFSKNLLTAIGFRHVSEHCLLFLFLEPLGLFENLLELLLFLLGLNFCLFSLFLPLSFEHLAFLLLFPFAPLEHLPLSLDRCLSLLLGDLDFLLFGDSLSQRLLSSLFVLFFEIGNSFLLPHLHLHLPLFSGHLSLPLLPLVFGLLFRQLLLPHLFLEFHLS